MYVMKMKKFLPVLAVCLFVCFRVPAQPDKCGDSVTWRLEGEWVIIISGTGAMYDYDESPPWAHLDSSVNEVHIEEGVTRVGNYAFAAFRSIKSIHFSKSVTGVGDYAFHDCDSIEKITSLNPTPPALDSTTFNNVVFGRATLEVPFGTSEQYRTIWGFSNLRELPETGKCGDDVNWSFDGSTVRISGTGAMYDYGDTNNNGTQPWSEYKLPIKTVIVEEGVTGVGNYAFAYNDSLSSVQLSETLTDLGEGVFFKCGRLKSIVISSKITKIPRDLCSHCTSLTSVVLPGNVTHIAHYAFGYCPKLGSIVCHALTPPGLDLDSSDGTTFYTPGLIYTVLRVSPSSVAAYKTASGWKDLATVRPNEDARLLNELSVNHGTLSPPFNPNIFSYNVKVPYDTTNIYITAQADSGARVTGNGVKQLYEINNAFKVTASDDNNINNKTVYTVAVERRNITDLDYFGDTYIDSFYVRGVISLDDSLMENEFHYVLDKSVPEQEVQIPSRISAVSVVAFLKRYEDLYSSFDSATSVKISPLGWIFLSAGRKEVTQLFTLEDGTKIFYTIVFSKDRESSTGLKDIYSNISTNISVHTDGNSLSISSPVSEIITVYDLRGNLLYSGNKSSGSTTINSGILSNKIFIVRGSSGWSSKVII